MYMSTVSVPPKQKSAKYLLSNVQFLTVHKSALTELDVRMRLGNYGEMIVPTLMIGFKKDHLNQRFWVTFHGGGFLIFEFQAKRKNIIVKFTSSSAPLILVHGDRVHFPYAIFIELNFITLHIMNQWKYIAG